MAEHRAVQADLSGKLRLMKAAIAALPEELRSEAEQPDYSPFPPRRPLPQYSPRVAGYYENLQEQAEGLVKGGAALGGGKRR